MGIIEIMNSKTQKEKYNSTLNDEIIPFPEFIDLLLLFTDDRLEVLAQYLFDSKEFLELDYYRLCYENGWADATANKFDALKDDAPPSYPTKDYLSDIIGYGCHIDDPFEYGWHVNNILNVEAIKLIGLDRKSFLSYRHAMTLNPKFIIHYPATIDELQKKIDQLTYDNELAQADLAIKDIEVAQAKRDLKNNTELMALGEYQKLLISYELFTPEQIVCLMINENPACISHDDRFLAHWDKVSTAIDAGTLTPINDKEQITAEQVKAWLAKGRLIYKGFNDNLPNDAGKTSSEPTAQISQFKELADAKARIEQQQREIEKLKEKAERAAMPANANSISNTDMQNIKKAAIKQFNRSLATVLTDLDYKGSLTKGDIVNFIIPHMENLAFVLADSNHEAASKLAVKYDTLYNNHLEGLKFKQGRQSNAEKNKVNIELLFKKQLPITE